MSVTVSNTMDSTANLWDKTRDFRRTLVDISTLSYFALPTMNNDFLSSYHHLFKEPALKNRWFKHRDIVPLIQRLPFEKAVIGQSFEKRSIHKVTLGDGPINVLLWSQMHGDEPTATMALFDIFRFFESDNSIFTQFRETILSKLRLHVVPMLNPDGAERISRRTALEIDMNRDALALQCPESRLLKELQQTIQPTFAFNLHDQGTRYSAGATGKQATISFLATAYNEAREWNDVRTRSMQVICGMNEKLQALIPGHVAKYSDEFEPRAFGDNIQKWGSSLILIESGGYKDDREKQFIRQLNFVAILEALFSIATNQYTKYQLSDYEKIPQNGRSLFDVLLRNVQFVQNGQLIKKDIGINLTENWKSTPPFYKLNGSIQDVGDLSTFFGIKEPDVSNLTFKSLKDYPALAQKYKGFTMPSATNIYGKPANFVLTSGQSIKYLVINGQLLDSF